MKEYAGVNLKEVDIKSVTALNFFKEKLLIHYNRKYTYDPDKAYSTCFIQCFNNAYYLKYLEHPGSTELIALSLKFFPEEKYIQGDTPRDKMLLRVKVALHNYGYTDEKIAAASVGKLKNTINCLIPKICLEMDWHKTAKFVHKSALGKNEQIAFTTFNQIVNLETKFKAKTTEQDLPYLISKQLINYIDILAFLSQDEFKDCDYMRNKVEKALEFTLKRLQELPEIKQQSCLSRCFSGVYFYHHGPSAKEKAATQKLQVPERLTKT
jgi:hypothetical protein